MKKYTRRAEDALKLSMSFSDVIQFYLTQIHRSCKTSIVHVTANKVNRLISMKRDLERKLQELKAESKGFFGKLKSFSEIKNLKKQISTIKSELFEWITQVYNRFVISSL